MTISAVRHLACSIVIVVAAFVFVHEAYASDSAITYAFPVSEMSGVVEQTAPGIGGCVVGCAQFRVASAIALPAKRRALLQIGAPSGTTIVGGKVSLRFRTKNAAISVHIQSRIGGRWLDEQRLRSSVETRKTVALGSGGTAVAISLTTDAPVAAHAIGNDAENAVTIDSVSLMVRDLSPPTVNWATGDPGSGVWKRGSLCGAFNAQDSGLGIDRVEYAVGSVVATAVAPLGSRIQPRPLSFSGTVCLDSAQLGDGTYGSSLTAVDSNVRGNSSASTSALVRVDNTPPSVGFTAPTNSEQRLPELALRVTDRASGVATVDVTLDGIPVVTQVKDDLVLATPPQPLADGLHRLSWVATDAAGNVERDGATFGVSDVTPPSVNLIAPQGTATSLAAISAQVEDSGSGFAIDSVRLAVDGSDVTSMVDTTGDTLVYRPTRSWAPGVHTVRLSVGDRSGNRALRTWSFQLPTPSAQPPSTNPTRPASQLEPGADSLRGVLTIDAPKNVVVRGTGTVIRVSVHRGDHAAAGQRIRVRWLHGGRLVDAVADDRGLAEIPVSGGTSDTLVLSAGGVQDRVVITTSQSLSLTSARRRVRQGDLVRLTGRLRGGHTTLVHLEAKVSHGWRSVANVSVDDHGGYSTPVRLPAVGAYVVRVRSGSVVSPTLRLVAE